MCRSHLVKVARKKGRLDAAGARVLLVTHDDPDAVRRLMLRDVDCPFPVTIDREKAAYQAWGLRQLPLPLLWLDPKVWRQYARLLVAGERMRSSGGDTRQMGGDFVVDHHGVIVYARPQRRDDRPPVGELINVIEALS
ncbi:MAG: peroxiredoxin-like family protein [Egibacteraceae bacterium]